MMNHTALMRRIAVFAAGAIFADCAAPQATETTPFASTTAMHAPHARDLLYVSNGPSGGIVVVYTYPRGKRLGTLSGFAGAHGLCVDAAGDVFVPFWYGFSGTYEFPHGAESPIALLGFNYSYANACSVDPVTGAVAVVGGDRANGGAAYVTIYPHKKQGGWGIGKSYEVSGMLVKNGIFCGFDSHGDLFCDGTDSSRGFVLAELAAQRSNFVNITLNQSILEPGQVQWDGAHLAIGDAGLSPTVIYQFDVSGSNATKVGSTTLKGSTIVEQFWIEGGTVIAPDTKRSCGSSLQGCIAFYRYPAGGSATTTIPLGGAFGATVSVAP